MPSILFVCTANRYRSPIAAAVFASLLEKSTASAWEVGSAGTWTKNGLPAIPEAVTKAASLGLDITNHRSRLITREMIAAADLVLVMEEGQKESLSAEFPDLRAKIRLLSQATRGVSYDIPDPVLDPEAGDVAMELSGLLSTYFNKIIQAC